MGTGFIRWNSMIFNKISFVELVTGTLTPLMTNISLKIWSSVSSKTSDFIAWIVWVFDAHNLLRADCGISVIYIIHGHWFIKIHKKYILYTKNTIYEQAGCCWRGNILTRSWLSCIRQHSVTGDSRDISVLFWKWAEIKFTGGQTQTQSLFTLLSHWHCRQHTTRFCFR